MKTGHKITLDIPDDIFKGIADFKKHTHIKDDSSAAVELIKYALTLPPYFAIFDWEKAEKEADADIAAGRVKSFTSAEGLIAHLKA